MSGDNSFGDLQGVVSHNNAQQSTGLSNNTEIRCAVCQKRFISEYQYERHLLTRHGAKSLKCAFCPGHVSYSKEEYQEHKNSVEHSLAWHQVKEYRQAQFTRTSTEPNLNCADVNIDADCFTRSEICTMCNAYFTEEAYYIKRHYILDHNLKQVPCSLCPGHSFSSADEYLDHVISSKHQTAFCLASGGKRESIHEIIRPFHGPSSTTEVSAPMEIEETNEHCDEISSKSADFSQESIVETNNILMQFDRADYLEKLTVGCFSCSECDHIVACQFLLELHLFEMHGAKSLQCPVCPDHTSTSKQMYEEHIQLKTHRDIVKQLYRLKKFLVQQDQDSECDSSSVRNNDSSASTSTNDSSVSQLETIIVNLDPLRPRPTPSPATAPPPPRVKKEEETKKFGKITVKPICRTFEELKRYEDSLTYADYLNPGKRILYTRTWASLRPPNGQVAVLETCSVCFAEMATKKDFHDHMLAEHSQIVVIDLTSDD